MVQEVVQDMVQHENIKDNQFFRIILENRFEFLLECYQNFTDRDFLNRFTSGST